MVCNESREPHTSHYTSNKKTTNKLLKPATMQWKFSSCFDIKVKKWGTDVSSPAIWATKISAHFGDNTVTQMSRRLNGQICSYTPSALIAGAKRSGATCHMAMPQCCYLAKGAKRPSHTTNTIKFYRIPFDPCNSIKRFDLSFRPIYSHPCDGSGTFRHQPFGRQYGVGHMGDNMASVTWATAVSTKWVDQMVTSHLA